MKKIFSLLFVGAALTFAACESKPKTEEATTTDSTAIVADTTATAVDTTATADTTTVSTTTSTTN